MSLLASSGLSLPALIVGIVFTFVFLVVSLTARLSAREREQKRRFDLIEKALDSGVIDDQTKRHLLQSATQKQTLAHPVFLLGWIGLFAGIGLIVLAATNHSSFWAPAIMTTAISFGVLSVPIAARELQSRRHA